MCLVDLRCCFYPYRVQQRSVGHCTRSHHLSSVLSAESVMLGIWSCDHGRDWHHRSDRCGVNVVILTFWDFSVMIWASQDPAWNVVGSIIMTPQIKVRTRRHFCCKMAAVSCKTCNVVFDLSQWDMETILPVVSRHTGNGCCAWKRNRKMLIAVMWKQEL